jgi:CHAD domain-containing protein
MKRETIRAYGLRCVGSMLDKTAYQMANATRVHSADSVHKLRVSIRRLQQALRLFREFLEEREVKRLRKQLRAMLQAAAEVRNRDIAAMLLNKTGAPAALVRRVEAERRSRMTDLLRLLRGRARAHDRWRVRLGL